ncbi:DUF2851 family protein [uncultured Cytophaga sp.]|uniref:DUF2851 family protein n=1 Tax=uncultured Cytophaga sp. TaxID=160238 RepID=UPI00261E6588|nr:DUF2851 family protein [uncultured Cytophaga sp.]
MVKEELLWVLWRNILFSVEDLKTTSGESIIIKRAGTLNAHAGPDFTYALVSIGGMEWCGDIEIHTKASDWNKHKHYINDAYESVILHVVYDADVDITRADGTIIPVLELKNRIDAAHIHTYHTLMENQSVVPCAHTFASIKPIVVEQMKQRVLIERLERKTESLFLQLKDQPNWKEVAGKLIFKSFGTGLNDFLFERLAHHTDFNKLDRLSYAPKSIEALFFGMAGMLEETFKEEYPIALAKEFNYLKRSLNVELVVELSEWKFLRTRPTNFPSIRLAQLAMFFSNPEWYHDFIGLEDIRAAKKLLNGELPAYWLSHYRFNHASDVLPKHIGSTFANTFMLNAYIPYLALEARYSKSEDAWDRVFQSIDLLKAEDNVITRKWVSLGMKMKSGFDSQASLELYKMYCTPKKCLSCSIGYAILRNAPHTTAVI